MPMAIEINTTDQRSPSSVVLGVALIHFNDEQASQRECLTLRFNTAEQVRDGRAYKVDAAWNYVTPSNRSLAFGGSGSVVTNLTKLINAVHTWRSHDRLMGYDMTIYTSSVAFTLPPLATLFESYDMKAPWAASDWFDMNTAEKIAQPLGIQPHRPISDKWAGHTLREAEHTVARVYSLVRHMKKLTGDMPTAQDVISEILMEQGFVVLDQKTVDAQGRTVGGILVENREDGVEPDMDLILKDPRLARFGEMCFAVEHKAEDHMSDEDMAAALAGLVETRH